VSNYERIEALARLVREKGVNREILVKSLHQALLKATEREYGTPQDIHVTWDHQLNDVKLEALMEVVEKVEEGMEHLQIQKKKARRVKPDAEDGEKLPVPVDISEFDRASVNIFRQEFLSLVRGAEREQVYREYIDKVGQIIPRCRVQQVYRNRVLVQVAGRIEAVVPAEERARGEKFNQNDLIIPVLIRVEKPESMEPQLVLSRATPLLVQRLFEREAPEIEEGVVEIRAMAREAGVRTKLAVASNDHRVDAVGAFVGVKGSRVQAVMRELNGERIDVIPWTMDKRVLASHALLPASVIHVDQYRETDHQTGEERLRMVAVVPDDHLSLAIGKNGHNVRLAGELVGCRIDIETQSLWEENRRWEEMLRVDASEIPGISDNVLEKLRLAGYDSANSIAEASEADLLDVHGVGPVRATQLMVEAKRLVEARKTDVERLKAEAEAGAGAQAAEDTSTSPEKGGTDD
jgi:transcription termination/antitermination protein NusA